MLQRVGRKKLLSLSGLGAILSLWCVGFGIDSGYVTLASVTIISFIAYVSRKSRLHNTNCSIKIFRHWSWSSTVCYDT